MVSINKPTIVPVEKYSKFSPLDREKYLHNIIKEILETNPQGVTASTIERNTSFSRRVVEKHLEMFVGTNQAYKIPIGPSIVYYPNERGMHPLHQEEFKINDKTYGLYLVENLFGKFLYIQEKKQQEFAGPEIMGGIMIPIEKVNDFVSFLSDVIKKAEKFEK